VPGEILTNTQLTLSLNKSIYFSMTLSVSFRLAVTKAVRIRRHVRANASLRDV